MWCFLDIEMPEKSGFELINAFQTINFHTVFVTAYDRYAIRAFEVSAIDYLLKPVDKDRLKEAVHKVAKQQKQKSYATRFEALQINIHSAILKKISIPYKGEHIVITIENIIAIEADRAWSNLWISNPRTKTVKYYTYSRNLRYFEQLFKELPQLQRVHKSWIVNTRYITSYSKKDSEIILTNNAIVPVGRAYKKVFEASLNL